MNESYYQLCKKELEKIDKPKKLLLHSCCAPCSSQVITFLAPYFDITIIYYNPNISPYEEYNKRKNEQIKLIKEIKTPNKINFLDCDYDNDLYELAIDGYQECKERGARCNICFKLRLEKTANIAKREQYDYYCSTLTVSPYKNANTINKIGKELEKIYKVKWLYSDFKKEDGYKKSIQLSKKYNLYRQNYCGCIYSKKEQEKKSEQI